eukprot:XP_025014591.1 exopolygalacturonase-like [Ricinus communis]
MRVQYPYLFSENAEANVNVFNVRKYGAKADGKSDISKALLSAWKDACATMGSNKIVIPKGVYFLSEADIKGPCKGAIRFQVRGTIKAPIDPSAHSKADSWIIFSYIDQFILNGGGTFDRQGEIAWKNNNCAQNLKCNSLPISLRFNFITNSIVQDIASIQSKNFHVNILGCKDLTFQNFTITAPTTSANTDGIHIGRSNRINITDSNISTSDDCISLGDGSQQICVTNVRCRPGHGISVGSLGKFKNEEPVSGFFVKNCTISNTTNRVRIKTWPGSYSGIVSDMHFEDIKMENMWNPIIIDQLYCPWNQCNPKIPSKVKISNISFKNIKGSSATVIAVQLNCSSSVPCEKVELADINLTYNGIEGPPKSKCANIKPKLTEKIFPSGC